MKDLTLSQIERQNVLNNRFAVAIIQEHLGLEAIYFNGQYWLTKKMVADFYEVEERTIERYIAQNEEELNHNGYILSKGKLLKELKLQFAPDIYDVRSKREYSAAATQLKNGIAGIVILPTYSSGVTLAEGNKYKCYIDDIEIL